MSIYKQATRQQLRFQTRSGMFSVEDLWQLDLEDLDRLAQDADAAINASATRSFIRDRSKKDATAELQLEILKDVIETKLTERDAASNRAARQAQAAQIRELLQKKQNEELAGKSAEDLEAMLGELVGS